MFIVKFIKEGEEEKYLTVGLSDDFQLLGSSKRALRHETAEEFSDILKALAELLKIGPDITAKGYKFWEDTRIEMKFSDDAEEDASLRYTEHMVDMVTLASEIYCWKIANPNKTIAIQFLEEQIIRHGEPFVI